MDEFASFNENFVLALFAVLLLTAMWGCAIVTIGMGRPIRREGARLS